MADSNDWIIDNKGIYINIVKRTGSSTFNSYFSFNLRSIFIFYIARTPRNWSVFLSILFYRSMVIKRIPKCVCFNSGRSTLPTVDINYEILRRINRWNDVRADCSLQTRMRSSAGLSAWVGTGVEGCAVRALSAITDSFGFILVDASLDPTLGFSTNIS